MDWRRVWNEWKFFALGCGVFVGALLVYRSAWFAGYSANSFGLLGCHFLRAVLLVLAYVAVVTLFKTAVRQGDSTAPGGVTLLDLPILLLILPGCAGLYPLWIAVLLISFLVWLVYLLAFVFSRNGETPIGQARRALLRAGAAALLFTATWYLCATVPRQAMHGLGARLEAGAGTGRLLAWAADVIAAPEQRKQKNSLAQEEVPEWVDALLGPFQGVRSVGIESGAEPCVVLYTGGSAYHFRIRICPSRAHQQPRPWWIGQVLGDLEWRPGIDLAAEGK
jgi:hypothetical protein